MKTLKIEVTAEDIRRGTRKDDMYCPIGLAAQRALKAMKGSFAYVCVWPKYLTVTPNVYEGAPILYELPFEARDFIREFDKSRSVEPFKVTLKRRVL